MYEADNINAKISQWVWKMFESYAIKRYEMRMGYLHEARFPKKTGF